VRAQLLGYYSTQPASSGRRKRSRPRWTAAMKLADVRRQRLIAVWLRELARH
jgi:hypothetical protein